MALLIGVLGVGQLNSQARPTEISSLSAQELSTLIETLTARNRELRTGLADIREQLREYEVSGPQGQSALQVSREDLRRITAFGGLAAVDGQGIVMEVDGDLDAIALNDLINELRNAGAEAIAVDGVRITARSVATEGPRSLRDRRGGRRSPLHAAGDRLARRTAQRHAAAGWDHLPVEAVHQRHHPDQPGGGGGSCRRARSRCCR